MSQQYFLPGRTAVAILNSQYWKYGLRHRVQIPQGDLRWHLAAPCVQARYSTSRKAMATGWGHQVHLWGVAAVGRLA